MPKVHIYPAPADGPDPGLGGIQRVIVGQLAHLEEFGWTYEADPAVADVIACHAVIPPTYSTLYPEKPFVNHNHGAYWSPDYTWLRWSYEANENVLNALRIADITTAVSEWTAQTLRRHSNRDIRVVHHGVDPEEWQAAERPGNYVLWNKTRVDPICNPRPLIELAEYMPEVPFVSTFGMPEAQPPVNVTLTDKLPFLQSKELIRSAGVYLCTTRETFGIGTLEALACGVPVVGYDWGGQREIIEHGVDGWLVRPDDIEGLAEGVRWAFEHRAHIAVAARRKAERFHPRDAAQKYAEVYTEALARHTVPRSVWQGGGLASEAVGPDPKVSVIVPVYNMGDFLEATLQSIAAQTMTDWECIIVNDASPDPRDREIALRYEVGDPRFRLIEHPENRYLAAARNTGIECSSGRYILPVDADDQLPPETLTVLSAELDADRKIHTAYGNVRFVEVDGATPIVYPGGPDPGHSGWPLAFDLGHQLTGPGQLLPYSSMYRREVWELTGGYRERARSSEDCDFWLRTTSYGFQPRMVTTADTLIYRVREGQMSQAQGWENHRPWYPWVDNRDLLPAAAVRTDLRKEQMPFPALDPALISVIIPVGPGHGRYVLDAIDSVDAQTFRDWECIVVNDSGERLPRLPQWVRVVCNDPECPCVDGEKCEQLYGESVQLPKPRGVAAARNRALQAVVAPLILPLDADDYLQADALQFMFDAHIDEGAHDPIVYSDFWEDPEEPGEFRVFHCTDFDPRALLKGSVYTTVALIPRRVLDAVGGWDEDLPGWEDWALSLHAAALGYCARRVRAPLFTYRKHTGMRRDENRYGNFEESKSAIMAKDYGAGSIAGCPRCDGGVSESFTPMRTG